MTKIYTLVDNQDDVFNISGETDSTSISGLGGNDNIYGGLGSDTINGGKGNDTLFGGYDGKDLLIGGEGNDYLIATSGLNGGSSTLQGGIGNDTYEVSASQTFKIVENAGEGVDTVKLVMAQWNTGYKLAANVENLSVNVVTGGYDDAWIAYNLESGVLGNELSNLITAQSSLGLNAWADAGNDTVIGSTGADYFHGQTGNDKLMGGEGNDSLYGDAPDDTTAGGNDTMDGGAGADFMQGGKGNDTYYVDNAGDQVIESAGQGTDTVISTISYNLGANVENLTFQGLTGLVGSGNALANTIVGSMGNDSLYGQDGNDKVYASLGNDLVGGGNGNDLLKGESGNDQLYGDANNDTLDGGTGTDYLDGGTGNDSLIGGADNDLLSGGAGDDVLQGDDGADTLQGGAGTDNLSGGAGNDWLQGGAGLDHMYGGAGADRFRFTAISDSPTGQAPDGVWDFQKGVDVLDLQMIDANANLVGNQTFAFHAARPFFTSAGDLWLEEANGSTTVKVDVNGDGGADFGVYVYGVTGMTASDFML